MPAKTAEKTGEDKVTAARNKNLDLAIQQIAKDYGDGAIMRLGDDKIVDIDVIPTGNILIDRALGVGGFPRGRVVEVFGPESSGKTYAYANRHRAGAETRRSRCLHRR
jgi:recombination protein RecA